MKEIYCDKCGKELKPGSPAIAITAGSISKYDEGFRPDEDPYIKTFCGDCCDVSKAIEDAPRADLGDLLLEIYKAAPKSERTLARWKYQVNGYKFRNDTGEPCLYRIEAANGLEIGAIRYYHGRLLCAYEAGK